MAGSSFLLLILSFCISLISVSSEFAVLHSIATIRSTSDRLTRQPDISFQPDSQVPLNWTLTYHFNVTYQRIHGFGGAFTEAACYTIKQLPQDLQEEILEAYYGANGLRYNIGRIPMGASDFSLAPYTFDDVYDDFSLSHFDTSVKHDVNNGMIPFIQRAIEKANSIYNPIRLFLTPWSPPGWMKTSNNSQSSWFPCMRSDPRVQQAWADFN